MTFTASDVLLKAASRIEEEGMWCQGQFFGDLTTELSFSHAWAIAQHHQRTAECAYGALMGATVELGLPHAVFEGAETALNRFLIAEKGEGIGRWNDRIGRTAAEVAEAMRRAASWVAS